MSRELLCTECRRPVKPVVAIDVDGTISDYHYHLLSFAREYLYLRVPWHYYTTFDGSMRLAEFMNVDDATYRQMKLAYRQGGQKRFQPCLQGARELCHSLKAAGAEVWITTTRPYQRYDSTDPDTRFWLQVHGIEYDHLLYDDDKYAVLSEYVGQDRVVGVLEDLGENYDRANELGLNPILIRHPWNAAIRRDVESPTLSHATLRLMERVTSWTKAR